ncbi:hypothetical protein [Streptomyces sp. NPDC020681]|uniref:bpX5 domain-containing protein n=1 Tax=Streptomyces sp. NPDC020681 TaxID=3365083 RepID=UPI0037955956
MNDAAFAPRWTPREPPLPAVAAAAQGAAARALADAVRDGLDDGRTSRLRAARADDGWLIVLSDDPAGADLPWADGVHWLGMDSGLLLPAHLAVRPDAALVAHAVARRVPDTHTLLALLPGHLLSAPVPRRPVRKEQLA